MKKYCKNCKFYWFGFIFGKNYCNANKKYGEMIYPKDTFYENKKAFKKIWLADEINKNNDCKYYKRKWYKFF